MLGLDSCALIDLFKGDERLINFLQESDEQVCVNVLLYLEIMRGINPGSEADRKGH